MLYNNLEYMSKNLIILLCIIILGAIVRFIWLDKIPHSVNTDELHYLLSAKSFALTGKDITQAVSPLDILTFRYPPSELVQAELPYFTAILTVGWLPFSLFGNAFPNAFLSLGLVLVMYLFVKKLFGEEIGLIASFLTAINPWFIVMGRTSYEVIPATFFYMTALYVMLIAKGWKLLLALPLLILAFYSYIATKLIFLPVVFVFCVFCYFVVHKKRFLKQFLVLLGACTIFVGFFIFQLQTNAGTSRMSEILTPAYPQIASQVDYLRKNTVNTPLLSFYENKLSIFGDLMLNNLSEVFSLKYLFLNGDYFFSFGSHGLMYLLDPVFLFIGAAVIYSAKKKYFWFLILLCGIAVLPQIVHSTSVKNGNFSPHTTMLLPFLIIFISAGIWEVISWTKRKKIFVGIVIVCAYVILLGNFLNIYFFHFPLQHNFFNFSSRLLSQYIMLSQTNKQPTIVYTPFQKNRFDEYLFYSNSYTKDNALMVEKSLKNTNYSVNNVTFLYCDQKLKTFDNKNIIIIEAECGMNTDQSALTIPQLSDSGGMYKIINDNICRKYSLKQYVSDFKMSDFGIDKMSPERFCQTFITAI